MSQEGATLVRMITDHRCIDVPHTYTEQQTKQNQYNAIQFQIALLTRPVWNISNHRPLLISKLMHGGKGKECIWSVLEFSPIASQFATRKVGTAIHLEKLEQKCNLSVCTPNQVNMLNHLKIAPHLEGVAPQFIKWGAVLHLRKKMKNPGLEIAYSEMS